MCSDRPEGETKVAGLVREHLAVCNDLLALASRESEALKSAAPYPAAAFQEERKALLKRLESALYGLVQNRALCQSFRNEGLDGGFPQAPLLQAALDTTMRVLVVDRENEQQLLRRGLVPARCLPAPERSQPGYVANLYQRHACS
jgi:hypothetical protein